MYTNVEGKTVFIANDGSSGCKYNFETAEELKQIILDYELEENKED